MITSELIVYIKNERAKGIPDSTINANLLANGWHANDIMQAMSNASNPAMAMPGGVPLPPIDETALIAYRKKLTFWLTLATLLLTSPGFIFTLLGTGGSPFGGSPESFMYIITAIGGLFAVYFAARSTTRGAKPQDKKWKEALVFIARLVGTIMISAVLTFGVFFVTCLFGMGSF